MMGRRRWEHVPSLPRSSEEGPAEVPETRCSVAEALSLYEPQSWLVSFLVSLNLKTTSHIPSDLAPKQEKDIYTRTVPVVTISRSRANLRCSVSGFYPMDIGVTWLRDGEPIPHSSNIDIRTWSNADGTYTLSNSLSVAPGGGQREGTYSCQVEHKSLPESHNSVLLLLPMAGLPCGASIALWVSYPALMVYTMLYGPLPTH
uniref:Tapasin-related protein n=1 Tax=Xenopus tropicalis TaxID=8364 RepID=A0A803J991_XENTR